jgi:hypothetical protein
MHEDDIIQPAGCTVMPLDLKIPKRTGEGQAVAICPYEFALWQCKTNIRSKRQQLQRRANAIAALMKPYGDIIVTTHPDGSKTFEKSTKPIKLSMISRIYNKLTTFFN